MKRKNLTKKPIHDPDEDDVGRNLSCGRRGSPSIADDVVTEMMLKAQEKIDGLKQFSITNVNTYSCESKTSPVRAVNPK